MDAATAAAWLADFARGVHEHSALLTELDRAIGDADHGANMDRGMDAVAALDPADFPDAAAYLKKVGLTLVSTIGGAAGPLFGTFFLRLSSALATEPDGSAAGLGVALRAGYEGVVARGKASEGDKTMVDALAPALRAYDEAAARGTGPALASAARAAALGRDATSPLVARKGRASYLGERSAGHVDPGAATIALLFESAARTLA